MSGAMGPPQPGEPRPGEEQGMPRTGVEEQAAGREAGEYAGEAGGERPEVLEKGAVYERSREQTERIIRENRNFVADYLDSLVDGFSAMARTLEHEGRGETATQVSRAAGELGRASKRVRRDSLVRLARDVEARAKERPAIAFGGAALAGFALSRILKSRPTGTESEED